MPRIRGDIACIEWRSRSALARPKHTPLIERNDADRLREQTSGVPVMKRSLFPLAVLLAVPLLGAADARTDEFLPPPVAPSGDTVAATAPDAPVSRLRLGRLDIVLEETPLAVVQEMLATGTIGERSDAADHIFWLCYTYDADGARGRVWLVSSSAFGGAEHVVDGVAAALVGAEPRTPENCPALQAGAAAWIDRRIWLGLDEHELIRRLGRPSEVHENVMHFLFDGDVRRTVDNHDAADRFAVTSYLTVELRDGRVARLWGWRRTSD
jgi:hypothetical protein